jgi:hypothetical protein
MKVSYHGSLPAIPLPETWCSCRRSLSISATQGTETNIDLGCRRRQSSFQLAHQSSGAVAAGKRVTKHDVPIVALVESGLLELIPCSSILSVGKSHAKMEAS